MEPQSKRLIFPDPQSIALAGAKLFLELGSACIQASGVFRVALSGGSTPKAMFFLLGDPVFAKQFPWDKVEWFWGDERSVPPDHSDSNFRMARELLLDRVGATAKRIHPMPAWDANPEAAPMYQKAIASIFGCPEVGQPPAFDLIFLGMGADGHTASLFPGTRALRETKAWVVANEVPQLATRRMTFTYPLINAAKTVCFLVAGADKADPLHEVLEGPPNLEKYPSQGVRPAGSLLWYLDSQAAAKLKREPDHG